MNHFVIDKFGRLINLEALTDNFYSDKIQMQSDFFFIFGRARAVWYSR